MDITSATLSPFQTISGTANTISNPTITFSNGILSAIWEPPVSGQVEQRYSDNFGATWSTTSSLAVDGTRSPNRTQIFGCGDQLILLAGSSASDGYAKVFARNADYSNSWTNLVSATSRSVMTKDAACLSGGRLLSVWTLGDYTVEYSLSTFTQGSWSSTPVASAPITSANIVTVAPTPDGGAAVATTGATIPGKTFGLKWTSDNSWGTQTLLYEVIGAAGQYPVPDVIDSVETSTGAVFAWKDFDLSGRLIPPVTSARIIAPAPAPAPAPTPNPDPALADTGTPAEVSVQLGVLALALGVLGVVATSASVRRVRAARSRARVR